MAMRDMPPEAKQAMSVDHKYNGDGPRVVSHSRNFTELLVFTSLAFYLYLGALWGPMGPQGGAKIPQNPFFTKRINF